MRQRRGFLVTITAEPITTVVTSSRRLVLELARFEAIRALRHPLTWVGAIASLWLMWLWGGQVSPVLPRDSVLLAGTLLPLAGSTLLVGFYAKLRQRSLPDQSSTFPAGPVLPVVGIHLGMVGPALLALGLDAIGLVYLLNGGPIGGIDWWELWSGPVMVWFAGIAGVFLARWLPHPIVAPVALVGVGVLQLVASPDFEVFTTFGAVTNFEWLAPWMVPSAWWPIEVLANRPSILHLAYLVLFALTLAILSLRLGARARWFKLGMVGSLVLVAVFGSVGLPKIDPDFDRFRAWKNRAAEQSCSTADGIEYCAFEFYRDWIPRWQATVANVDQLFPVDITRVMQRPHNSGFDEQGVLEAPGLVLTSTHWDRQGAASYQRLGLSLLAAQSAVGLPTTLTIRRFTPAEIESIVRNNPDYPGDLRAQYEDQPATPNSCSAVGQARSVVAVWLAAAALDDGKESLDLALSASPTSPYFVASHMGNRPTDSIVIGGSDALLARQLLDVPAADVRSELQARWEQVIDPSTTAGDLASWFGLTAPQQVDLGFVVEPCP